MRLSTLFGRTLREAPSEAEHPAYQLILRAALVQPVLAGGYALLPLGMRVARRIEAIMHEELARIDAQELRTPLIQPAETWQQSGRYSTYGPLMLRITGRGERALIFAPTHEEAIAGLARREINSYRQMPALVYQIHTKYRDELRARGGLMRMREFTMLDAYSLDADAAGLDQSYARVAEAFERIFTRCGVRFVSVEADSGEMGGREPREYHALSPAGEDTLVICAACGYAANLEVAVSGIATTDHPFDFAQGRRQPTTEDRGWRIEDRDSRASREPSSILDPPSSMVATPGCATIAEVAAFLGVAESATAKAVFFDTPERGLLFAVIRGDLEINEARLRAVAGVSDLTPASAEQIAAIGAVAGYASPVGLRIHTDHRPSLRLRSGQATTDHRQSSEDGGSRMEDSSLDTSEMPSSEGVLVIADRSVVGAGPLVAGANQAGYHLRDVVYGRDWHATQVADIAAVRAGDPCAHCGAPLTLECGIEIGHIFKLGTHFSEALGAHFLDQGGAEQPVVMGSYGIGIERLMQVIVEQHHDAAGIVWPAEVAPLDVQLLRIGKSDAVRAAADMLYAELELASLRVLYDDRDESAGVKFNDADLIGLPVRVLVSERLLAEQMVEIKPRAGTAARVARGEAVGAVRAAIEA